MTPDKTCAQLAAETDRKVRAFKKEAKELVTQLPDTPLSDSDMQSLRYHELCHRAVEHMHHVKHTVIQSSALINGILSPSYYITRTVKLRLIALINKTESITVLDKKIRGLLDTGWLEDTNKNRDRVPEAFLITLGKLWLGEEDFNVYAKGNPKIYPSYKGG